MIRLTSLPSTLVMRHSLRKLRSLAIVALLAAAPASVNAQVILFSSFDNDDTSFFTYSGPPSGQLSFDPSLGFPNPGSMRLTRNELTNSAVARTDCQPFDPARRYSFQADSLQQVLGGTCELSYNLYTTTDCTGDEFIGSNATTNSQAGAWERLETFAGTAALGQEAFASIRFRMVLFGAVVPSACNFDNVSIVSEQVESIPTLGRSARLLFLVAIPFAAVILLRAMR